MKRLLIAGALLGPTACVTYPDVQEIRTVSFSDDVSKGKSQGQFSADDCTWTVLGYPLGGAPEISKAIANAKSQKKTTIADSFTSGKDDGKGAIRYANNIAVRYTGFNAYVVGKSCIEVTGVGYL